MLQGQRGSADEDGEIDRIRVQTYAGEDMVVDPSPLLRVLVHRVEPRVDRQTVDNAARPRLAVDRSLAILVAKLVLEDLDVGDATRCVPLLQLDSSSYRDRLD